MVAGVADPNPVAEGGAEALRAAGVDVQFGVCAAEVSAGNIAWLTAVRRGRPYLVWKLAATLDGRSAAADGTSMWITSEQARTEVHELRARTDAIIAGVGTVLADDPRLTVRNLRDNTLAIRQPLRVVVDSAGLTPASARVRDLAAQTWVATAAEVGADPAGRVDLPRLMSALYQRGVRSALLEGGPTLAGSFLRERLVDQVVAYLSPLFLGAGIAALGPAGVGTLADAIQLEIIEVARVGPDLRVTAVPRATEV